MTLMHTCPPPIKELNDWLEAYPSTIENYGHLLLEQKRKNDQPLLDALREYFESAHLDAREYIHASIGIDLHPDAEDVGAHACYPNCLPKTTRRGLFGEVMAGLITESYKYVGNHNWVVPVFLFRYHNDAEQYLFDLSRDNNRTRTVFGRPGSDFIGLSLGEDRSVVRFIVGEAKWRQKLQPAVIEELLQGEWETDSQGKRVRSGGIWDKMNKDTSVPHGMRQLQRLLLKYDPDNYSATIFSMDRALVLKEPVSIPRTDLILIAGNDVPSRGGKAYSLIPWEEISPEYTAGNDLQIVELILNNGEELIDAIYDSLWMGED